MAQQAPAAGANTLPPVVVSPAESKPRKKPRASREADTRARRAAQAPARTLVSPLEAAWAGSSQTQRTGTVGYYQNSTSVATKTNTPLLDIPQSVSVLTRQFLNDQAISSVTDAVRYVPGVVVHQGEGNRDELVIRGVDSSANFFVNGFRDDVQYFRDLYNAQSVEVLKGPSALTFGRGAGGGLVNRTLKEADGTRIYEATAQTGSYDNRRFSLDAGQAVNENVAVRLNAFYEGSDTFRDYGNLERYGINPTITLRPSDDTKIKLSYEYYHDKELADRGNPSFNGMPFVPNGDYTKFFGSPIYNTTHADVQQTMAVIEHDFGGGLTGKNSTMYANYDRGYVNVYPGGTSTNIPGVVNPSGGAVVNGQVSLNAYENTTNRANFFNQTDFTYKTYTGPIRHTIAFGTEFGQQTGLGQRNTGFFPDNPNPSAPGGSLPFVLVNAFNPTYFGPVVFQHLTTSTVGLNADANSSYRLFTESAYVQDQIDVTRWLQLFAGARYDRFDLAALDQNTGINRSRVDDKISPRAAVIFKPVDEMSIYGAYSISYLPASGDQFSSLNPGTLILDPQKFENTEFGLKWNVNPKLQYTAAVYELNRTNQPIPVGGGFSLPNGSTKVRGFETAVTGFVTADWQTTIGYAYTDARITSDLSTTIVTGNRVQLVPYNQVSLWNKYQIDPRWALGVGVLYLGDSYASSDDTVKLPSWVRVDAGVYYKYNETWSGQLSVENLFDKGYWASADGNNNISPGRLRTFRVSATARF
ncbi:MAG: TonB-dependent siderophore receptor [Bradyrhizobiaceae bacterium]|nr:MAG: TonB-dependent siderophore receptor [Bradyrhizobiaceae bacterium]